MNYNLDNFDWGPTSEGFKKQVTKEVFDTKRDYEFNDYERFFRVEENDVVVDIGSTVGEFTYSILHRNPKHVYVVEPISVFFDTLKKNLQGKQVSFTNAAITSDKFLKIKWDGVEEKVKTLTFNEFIENNRLFDINFMKVDCEGGEYDVFSLENLQILKQIPKIVVEFHLGGGVNKEKFRNFRNNILPEFSNYKVYSIDGINIEWDLQNEHFIEYYREVMLYIDNRN